MTPIFFTPSSHAPCEVGYPAVMKETNAASPFSLAASKAASILPPTPRSISATETGVSADATLSLVEVVDTVLTPLITCLDTPPPMFFGDNVEKATVVEAIQPNQSDNEANLIRNLLFSNWICLDMTFLLLWLFAAFDTR